MCSFRPRGLDTDAVLPSGDELDQLLDIACQVARACGHLIVDERPARVEFTTKSTEVDVVTVMDRRSEELARLRGETCALVPLRLRGCGHCPPKMR